MCGLVLRRGGVLTVGSLFSGIEGFGLGFQRAGAEVRWHVEIDKDCQRVIRAWFERESAGGSSADGHLPTAHERRGKAGTGLPSGPDIFGEVRAVGAHNLPAVDLICGGFPCQDLSVAGRRAGLAGERSGLWHEFHRILSELRPRWVVIENVPGLLSSNEGRDMATVLRGLGELGYGWAYRVLDAQYFGVAQRRRRVFIVGCLGNTARAVQVLFESESCDGDSAPSRQAREGVAGTLGGGSGGRGWPQDTERMTFLPVAYALRSDASRSGEASNPSRDAAGKLRKRDAGFNVETERVPTLDSTAAHYVAPMLGGGNYGQGNLDEGVPMMVAMTLPSTHRGVGNGWNTTMVRTANTGANGHGLAEEVAHTLDGANGQALAGAAAVRRLTPVECERLQGFPDGWTAGHADSTRYRMLGNAVCVPVAEWIGLRITKVALDG